MATLYPANVGRQYGLFAVFNITGADIAAGRYTSGANIANALDLPSTYIIYGGYIYVATAFNGTTATVTVGDSGSSTRFGNAVDLKTAAATALTNVPFYSGTIGGALMSVAWTGSPTTGNAYVILEYLIPGRSNEVQTN